MDSETLQNAVKKASFDTIDILIKSDGITATIDSIAMGRDRLVHVEFPCDVEGEWGITDPGKLLDKLKKIKGDIKIIPKNDALFISGGSRKIKCPIADDNGSLCNCSTLVPTRVGSDILFNAKPAATLPAVFSITNPSKFKNYFKGEDEYKLDTKITFKKSMNVFGTDTTDYAMDDSIEGEYLVPFSSSVDGHYHGIDEIVKVLGKDSITICMGQDSMMYIEDVDGNVKSTFIVEHLDKNHGK